MYSNEIKRKALILKARSYLGVRFCHQGRSRVEGFDCVGLICHVLKDVGVNIKSHQNYVRRPKRGALLQAALEAGFVQKPYVSHEKIFDLQQGDILLFHFGKRIEHAAFYTDIGILHADEKSGKIIEHRLDDRWEKRIFAVLSFDEIR